VPVGGFSAAVAAAAPTTGGELPTVSCLSLLSDCKLTFQWQAINLAPMGPGSVFCAASMQHSPAQALELVGASAAFRCSCAYAVNRTTATAFSVDHRLARFKPAREMLNSSNTGAASPAFTVTPESRWHLARVAMVCFASCAGTERLTIQARLPAFRAKEKIASLWISPIKPCRSRNRRKWPCPRHPLTLKTRRTN
jgi:hypothetical protein